MKLLKSRITWPQTIFLGGAIVTAGALVAVATAMVVGMQVDQFLKDVEY